MKKVVFLIAITLTLPTFAACSIEESTSCSIAEFRQTQFVPTYDTKPAIPEFSDTPDVRLNPVSENIVEKQLRSFGPQPSDYSYNTSCQFGVCNNSGAPELFRNR